MLYPARPVTASHRMTAAHLRALHDQPLWDQGGEICRWCLKRWRLDDEGFEGCPDRRWADRVIRQWTVENPTPPRVERYQPRHRAGRRATS